MSQERTCAENALSSGRKLWPMTSFRKARLFAEFMDFFGTLAFILLNVQTQGKSRRALGADRSKERGAEIPVSPIGQDNDDRALPDPSGNPQGTADGGAAAHADE